MKAPAWLTVMVVAAAGCDSPSSPSAVLTATLESASFSYRFNPGDVMEVDRQEAHHAWAIGQLGVVLPQKISYNRYRSRAQMGEATGQSNTNGFAEPEKFAVHTLWTWDNHEPVHVYSALVGRPSDFFNEGLAVAFQTDPAAGDFQSKFNGQDVHQATAQYRAQGLLPPLDQIVGTTGFREISDSTRSYRIAGSFVRFLIDTYGMAPLKSFFAASTRTDSPGAIQSRFQSAFGVSLAAAEAAWLARIG